MRTGKSHSGRKLSQGRNLGQFAEYKYKYNYIHIYLIGYKYHIYIMKIRIQDQFHNIKGGESLTQSSFKAQYVGKHFECQDWC